MAAVLAGAEVLIDVDRAGHSAEVAEMLLSDSGVTASDSTLRATSPEESALNPSPYGESQRRTESSIDATQLVELAVELLDLCRPTQRPFLDDNVGRVGQADCERHRTPAAQLDVRCNDWSALGAQLAHA